MFGRSRKRLVRVSLFTANLVLLIAVVSFVLRNPNTAQNVQQSASLTEASAASPLDQLSSADIAVHVSRLAQLDEATAVTNQADTVNAQLAITPADTTVVAKPQIVTTALRSRKDIINYVTVAGDTISGLASKFNVTSDTLRWSNGLAGGDSLPAGKELWVLPGVNGIIYTVKQGDTPESLASRFHANKDSIIAYNDAEVSGLPVGQRIIIPDGVQVVARAAAPSFSSFAARYGGNGYDYGYCTWWVAVRRAQVGKPIPSNLGNASTWKVLAQRAGLAVGNTPRQYAVIWTPPRDYYGHVGFVESVDADGTVHISEMNTVGWNKVSYKTLTPAQAAGYSYIY